MESINVLPWVSHNFFMGARYANERYLTASIVILNRLGREKYHLDDDAIGKLVEAVYHDVGGGCAHKNGALYNVFNFPIRNDQLEYGDLVDLHIHYADIVKVDVTKAEFWDRYMDEYALATCILRLKHYVAHPGEIGERARLIVRDHL